MPETENTQVASGERAEAAADLEEQEDVKQDQVLQREGVETALMDDDSSEAGEHIDGVEASEDRGDKGAS